MGSKSNSRKNADAFSKDASSKVDAVKLEHQTPAVHIVAYIGFDYECPIGHRFICSGPDRLVKISPNGIVKVDETFKNSHIETDV